MSKNNKMSNLLYYEKQSFKKSFFIWIPIGLFVFFMYGFYKQFYLHIPFGDHPMSDSGYIFFMFFMFLFNCFFISISLETKIDQNGIRFRFFPIQLKENIISWEEISKIEVMKYNPILEFGGWGYRGFKNSSKRALNISGDKGVKLYFTNGKTLLIGTQKPEEIKLILSEIDKIKTKLAN